MALTSTVYNFELEIADAEKSVYASKSLAVARHPSENLAFMLARVIAYALEYRENLEFSKGLSDSEEPALWAKDLTGRVEAWIEIGSPSPERIHRARKSCDYVAIYCHKDPRLVLEALRKKPIHRAESVMLCAIDPKLIEMLEPLVEKRNRLSLSRSDGVLYCELAGVSAHAPLHSEPITKLD